VFAHLLELIDYSDCKVMEISSRCFSIKNIAFFSSVFAVFEDESSYVAESSFENAGVALTWLFGEPS